MIMYRLLNVMSRMKLMKKTEKIFYRVKYKECPGFEHHIIIAWIMELEVQ